MGLHHGDSLPGTYLNSGPCVSRGAAGVCPSRQPPAALAVNACDRPIFRTTATRPRHPDQSRNQNRQFLRGDPHRDGLGGNSDGYFLWKPTALQSNSQNAVERRPAAKLHSATFQPLLVVNTTLPLGPYLGSPFAPIDHGSRIRKFPIPDAYSEAVFSC